MEGRGWKDIGYHLLIDGEGTVYQGRPLSVVGAHVKGKNTGNIGISLIGNYDTTAVPEAMFSSLVKVLTWLNTTYGIPASEIRGHRDQQATICPGGNLYALLPFAREKVAAGGALTVEAGEAVGLPDPAEPWRTLPTHVPPKPTAVERPWTPVRQVQTTTVTVAPQAATFPLLLIAAIFLVILLFDD
jgi:hypothetical protein